MPPLFDHLLTPFSRALAGVLAWDLEAIHQSRIGSRRLRELVPLLGFDHEIQRSVSRQLRRVTRRLGRLRELDVLAAMLSDLRRKGHATRAIDRLDQAIAEETLRTRHWVTRRLGKRRLAQLRAALEHMANELTAREATHLSVPRPRILQSAIDARIARRAHRLYAAIDHAGAMYSPDALHDVRIAVKKLRYALELSLEARGRQDPATIALLKGAQNTLGRLHDLEMLIRRVRGEELKAEFDLLSELTALADEAQLKCRQLHGRYLQQRAALATVASGLCQPARKASRVRERAVV